MTPARARQRFGILAFALLATMLGLWWFLTAPFLELIRPLASWALQQIGMASAVTAQANGGWLVSTRLWVSEGAPEQLGRFVQLSITEPELRYGVRSFPIFLALLATPPWPPRPVLAVLIGSAILTVQVLLGALVAVNLRIAITLNGEANPVIENYPVPTFRVFGEPYSDFAFWLSGMVYYLFTLVIPLGLPVLVWAALNKGAVRLLLARGETAESSKANPA